jgi:hypothetical protein
MQLLLMRGTLNVSFLKVIVAATHITWRWDSSVGIAMAYNRLLGRDSITGSDKRFFSSP